MTYVTIKETGCIGDCASQIIYVGTDREKAFNQTIIENFVSFVVELWHSEEKVGEWYLNDNEWIEVKQ